MVTNDGAIVLQDEYREVADEIEIVLKVKSALLDGICTEEEIRPPRRSTGNSTSHVPSSAMGRLAPIP
jgi:hypothetical protein